MKKFFYIIFFNLMLIIKSLLFSGLGYSETLIKSHGISSFGNLKYSKDSKKDQNLIHTLMGNDVALRKDFIISNAINVQNLDI